MFSKRYSNFQIKNQEYHVCGIRVWDLSLGIDCQYTISLCPLAFPLSSIFYIFRNVCDGLEVHRTMVETSRVLPLKYSSRDLQKGGGADY